MILYILKGLPASGKSTFAKKYVAENPTTRVRVCRDDIRRQFGPYWVPKREKLVTKIEQLTVKTALMSGYSVVVDATNLNKKYYKWPQLLEQWSKESGFPEVKLIENDIFLEVSVEECIKRDSKRSKDEHVGADTILRMAENIEDGKPV